MSSNSPRYKISCQLIAEGSIWTLCSWQGHKELSSKSKIHHTKRLENSLKKWLNKKLSNTSIQRIRRFREQLLTKYFGKMKSWKTLYQRLRKWIPNKVYKKKFRLIAKQSLNYQRLLFVRLYINLMKPFLTFYSKSK